LRDKNVKIIKQTKNEILEKVAASQEDDSHENSSSDSSFERMSNDDLNNADTSPSPFSKAELDNGVTID
jgi:hypothetical protein